MPLFDLFLLGFLAIFIVSGFIMGFIRLIGWFFGIVIGVWLAGVYYESVARWFIVYVKTPENLSRVISFFLIFLLVSKIVSLIFKLLDRLFKILSIIPFTKTLNRLVGLILGAVEGLLILSVLIFFLSRYSLNPQIDEALKQSKLASIIVKFIFPLWPLLPEMIKKIKAII